MITFVQHVAFEDPGCMTAWAVERGYEARVVHLYRGDTLPDKFSNNDWLVVMGGPMGAYDEAQFPWMSAEKRAISAALSSRARVIGVCLGAQLMASVMGARVTKNREPEIGWFDVRRVRGSEAHPLAHVLPASLLALHWHGDTFAIPPGTTHLYESDACANQMFATADGRAVGMQFHLEVTPAEAENLANADPIRDTNRPYVQPIEQIVRDRTRFARANDRMRAILDAMAAL